MAKNSMTGSKENNEFFFPIPLMFPEAKPNSKIEKTAKKSFAWRQLTHKFAAVSKSTTWSRASPKFKLLFP